QPGVLGRCRAEPRVAVTGELPLERLQARAQARGRRLRVDPSLSHARRLPRRRAAARPARARCLPARVPGSTGTSPLVLSRAVSVPYTSGARQRWRSTVVRPAPDRWGTPGGTGSLTSPAVRAAKEGHGRRQG